MPKSKTRTKAGYTPPPGKSARKAVSPPWLAPMMLTLFLVGIIWIVVFYVSGGDAPGQKQIGNWNLLIGFGLIIAGFITSTQWR